MTVDKTMIAKFRPHHGWGWGDVEGIIYTGISAAVSSPDKEEKYFVQRVCWPEIKKGISHHVNALQGAETAGEQIEALKGRFTVQGYRAGMDPADIDKMIPAFALICMIPDKDKRYFNAVMRSKVERRGRVDWSDVRKQLGLLRGISRQTIYKRYQRILLSLAKELNHEYT